MRRVKDFLRRYWSLVVLVVVWGWVVWKSFEPGTWLLGWDNLVPEWSIGLEFKRLLWGVWQEYRGVGVLGGMAHIADLPRVVILWVLHWVVPRMYLRWLWHLGMLLLGPVGVWWWIRNMFNKTNFSWAGLMGGLFYLLNPATLQYFYTPYESFSSFYGFFPWLMGLAIGYLRTGKKRFLRWFLVVSVLGTSAFYVQTLFVVYVLILGIWLLIFSLGGGGYWKRIIKIVGVVVAVNAFWLLPVGYFSLTNSKVTVMNHINSIATPETALMNRTFGNWKDVLGLRGYWLEYGDWKDGNYANLMSEGWYEWLMKPEVGAVGMGMGVVVVLCLVLGVLNQVRKRRGGYLLGIGLLGTVLLVWLMLGSYNPPFGFVYDWLVKHVPLFREIFRSGFTKWSVAMAWVMAVAVGRFSRWRKKWLGFGVVGMLIGGMMYVMWPVFGQGVVYKKMKVKVPQEYFEMFEFFERKPVGRVAYFPTQTFWGWNFLKWGYRGSGFLWYGIEQPILDRAFDVWSPYNEGFYQEMSTAIYGDDTGEVEKVLDKYDVSYVLLDESVVAPGQDEAILRIPEIKRLAGELGWKQVWSEGFLTVWEMGERGGKQFVDAPSEYRLVEADTSKVRWDGVWDEVGTYVEDGFRGYEYPFAELMREEVEGVRYKDDKVVLERERVKNGELVVPGFAAGEPVELTYQLTLQNGELRIEWEPVYRVNGQDGPSLASLSYQVKEQYLWVGIGENEAVFVEEGKPVRGRARLAVGEPAAVKIYSGVVVEEQRPELRGEQRCGEENEYRCYAIPLAKSRREGLMQAVVSYQGRPSPELCLDLEGEPYVCANLTKMGADPLVSEIGVKRGERYWLDLVLRGRETEIKGVEVRWYGREEVEKEGGVEAEQWRDWGEERRFNLQDSSLRVEVPGKPRSYDLVVLGRGEGFNCDALERGTAGKDGERYEADEYGVSCDYAAMSGLNARAGYLLRLRGENKAGRSLKFFLYNTGNKRNDLEYLLDEQEFEQTFALLPWRDAGSYTLNVETRSFGRRSENVLEPVEARWFPLRQVAGMRIGEGGSESQKSGLEVKQVKKTGTWWYRVETEGGGLLTLSQGYEAGWVGVKRIPGTQRFEVMKHVEVDGWKNGWLVKDGGGGRVTIFYWPQLLEYLGFGLLGAGVVWVGRKKRLV